MTRCGSKNNTYSVTICVKQLGNNEEIIARSGNFSSEYIKSKPFSYYGFNIFFDRPVFLSRKVLKLIFLVPVLVYVTKVKVLCSPRELHLTLKYVVGITVEQTLNVANFPRFLLMCNIVFSD